MEVAELDREIDDFELSKITGLSRVTLQMKRQQGTGPVFKKYSNRSVRYVMRDVKAWMDAAPRLRSTSAQTLHSTRDQAVAA